MKKILLISTTLIYLAFNSTSQTFDTTLATKLQNKLDSLQLTLNIKGISASIVYPGQGQWKGVTGESYTGVPIISDMEFAIASNTKTFTAVMLLKLVENGIVNLDDSLHNWLPSYNLNIDSNITIRQMLNHTSGIANTFDVVGYMDSLLVDLNRVLTPQEILSWLPAPLFPAGTSQSYSNPNYNLTGLIIESATGQDLEQLIRDSILTPLNLDSTFFPIDETITGIKAHPWQAGIDWNDSSRTSLLTAQWASGAMYSTAGEMAHWYNELLNNQFLNASEYNEMTTFIGSGNIGIGIHQVTIAGRTAYGHGGTALGFSSIMIYDTTLHASIAVLINDNPVNQFIVAEELLLTFVNNLVLSVEDNSKSENAVLIYPNPTSNLVQVNIENHELDKIKIYSILGKLVKVSSTSIFSISNLPNGQYLVFIQTNNGNYTKKIVKK